MFLLNQSEIIDFVEAHERLFYVHAPELYSRKQQKVEADPTV